MTQQETVVIDNGSCYYKIGFSGGSYKTLKTTVGHAKYVQCVVGSRTLDSFVSDLAQESRGILNYEYPIEHGIITNFEQMERIWFFSFYNILRVDPSTFPVLLTEPFMNPTKNREKIITSMFESLNVKYFNLSYQGVLSLYSTFNQTGIVVDCGDGVTEITPIYDGYLIEKGIIRQNFGGDDLINYLKKILMTSGYDYTQRSSEKEIVRDIIEKKSFVALNYQEELMRAKKSNYYNSQYEQSDGTLISLSDEHFRCTELLFQPKLDYFEYKGIDETLYNSIMKCDINTRKSLFSNIILCGGTTMIDGFPQRLTKGITALAPKLNNIQVLAPPERQYAAWLGGSIFSYNPSFSHCLVSREEYLDCGPRIVHYKFNQFTHENLDPCYNHLY